MTRTTGWVLGVGATAALIAGVLAFERTPQARAQGRAAAQGGVFLEPITETHRWRDRNHHSANVARTKVLVPETYGRLVSSSEGALWFQDDQGVLRNVLCEGLVQIERVKTDMR